MRRGVDIREGLRRGGFGGWVVFGGWVGGWKEIIKIRTYTSLLKEALLRDGVVDWDLL
jgi:hypothetical protein